MVVVLLICATLLALPAQDSTPAFNKKIQQADTLLKTRQWEPALKAYRDANALADKKSAAAHIGIKAIHEKHPQ